MREECVGFATRLGARLEGRGLTHVELGRRMAATARLRGLREIAPVPRQTISEWVRGRRLPAPDYALILCCTLEVTPASLALEGMLTPGRVEEIKQAAHAKADSHRPEGRPGGSESLDLESVNLTAVLHSTREVDRHAVNAQWGITLDLLELRRRRPALTLLPVYSHHMVSLRELMRLAASERVWRELAMQTAEMSCASAMMWHTQLDLGRAMSGYQFALRLAHEMDEDSIRAMAFTGMALLYADQLHEGEGLPAPPSTSQELMAEAEKAASGCAPPHQLWLHAARSWQRAGRQDVAGAGHDLEAAHRALAKLRAPAPGFLATMDGGYVTVCEAKCASLLGDPAGAVRIYERASAESTSPMSRMFYDVERARAAIAAGEVELAVGLLSGAVDEGDRAGSTMITRRVRTIAAGRLAQFGAQPDVKALAERLGTVA